ncbi:NAD(+) kinase [Halobacteriales archaeon QS_1_68_20]|nr:MAG: NAD(+) kinase [Halobacteriales archaeon QS_1_68_20]
MRLGIVAQKGNQRAVYLADDLREALDVAVDLDETTASALDGEGVPVEELSACDLVVSIGGDGTFLFAARGVGDTPILGVNLGEVGFLNAVQPGAAVEAVSAEVDRYREEGAVRSRTLDRVRVAGDDWSLPPALNEVVVQGPRRGHGGGVDYEVRVDGSLYGGGRADGVLVATPTGSTAYNLSEGGPLVHPEVDALLVNEMAASDPMPPLAVPVDARVTVQVESPGGALAISDGRNRRELSPPEEVTVERAAEPVRVAGPAVDFFEAIGKLD